MARNRRRNLRQTEIPVSSGACKERPGGASAPETDMHPGCEPERPLVTIITVVRNGAHVIEDAILSVSRQTYENIEYIVIDGASDDGTMEVLRQYDDVITGYISERDHGLYDAMNKGLARAKGQIVGFLNADDYYADKRVIEDVVEEFNRSSSHVVYGNLVIVSPDEPSKTIRYYDASHFSPDKFAFGWMPPHPTVFVKRTDYERCGGYRRDYAIAADYELLLRLLWKMQLKYSYLDRVMVKMRAGGVSTRSWRSNVVLNREIMRACRENGLPTSWWRILSKYPRKLTELFRRPPPRAQG